MIGKVCWQNGERPPDTDISHDYMQKFMYFKKGSAIKGNHETKN